MYELADHELDAVAAGHGSLIHVDVQNVLNNLQVDVDVPIEVRDVNAQVVAAVAVLGTAGAVGNLRDL